MGALLRAHDAESAVTTTRKGPGRSRGPPCRAGVMCCGAYLLDHAGDVFEVLEGVVLAVLEDADGGLRRGARRVQVNRAGDTVIVDVLACLQQCNTVLVRRALGAVSRNLLKLAGDRL